MKKQTSIFAVICAALFIFSTFASAGVSLPEVTGWTWSSDLNDNGYFRWEVSMYNDTTNTPVAVTVPDEEGPGFVDGSVMEVWVNNAPHGLQFPDDEAQYHNFFGFNFDGDNSINTELLPVLVFPNTYQTSGEDMNYFHYTVDNGSVFLMFENEENNNGTFYNFYNNGNEEIFNATVLTLHQDKRNVTETFLFGVGDGIMKSFQHHEVYSDGTVLEAEIALVAYENYNNNGDDEFLQWASFDPSLNAGDSFTWDVLKNKENGVSVTDTGDNGPAEGSEIRIDIVGEPENLNLTDENTNPEDYFALFLDGEQLNISDTFEGPGDFIQFIFPKVFDFQNGTVLDFFEYAAANPSDVWDGSDSASAVLSDGLFTLKIDESYDENGETRSSTQTLVFDADTGVMQYMHRYESYTDSNGSGSSEIELLLQGATAPTGTTSSNTSADESSTGAGLPLPGFGFYMIISALIAIPFIRRKY